MHHLLIFDRNTPKYTYVKQRFYVISHKLIAQRIGNHWTLPSIWSHAYSHSYSLFSTQLPAYCLHITSFLVPSIQLPAYSPCPSFLGWTIGVGFRLLMLYLRTRKVMFWEIEVASSLHAGPLYDRTFLLYSIDQRSHSTSQNSRGKTSEFSKLMIIFGYILL